MGAQVLLPLTVKNSINSKPELKVDSLSLLGLDPMTSGTQWLCSNRTAESHPDRRIM
jgi:hypothetical protein